MKVDDFNLSIEANIKSTVPSLIRSMMSSQITPSLKEQNVLMYIGGYIVKKQEYLYCSQCVPRLTEKKDMNSEVQTFINLKENVHVLRPTLKFLEALEVMETSFVCAIEANLHEIGIRNKIVQTIMANQTSLDCMSQDKCKTKLFISFLFVNIRLHHHIKCSNFVRKDRSIKRKADTFNHL